MEVELSERENRQAQTSIQTRIFASLGYFCIFLYPCLILYFSTKQPIPNDAVGISGLTTIILFWIYSLATTIAAFLAGRNYKEFTPKIENLGPKLPVFEKIIYHLNSFVPLILYLVSLPVILGILKTEEYSQYLSGLFPIILFGHYCSSFWSNRARFKSGATPQSKSD